MYIVFLVLLITLTVSCWFWLFSHATPDKYQEFENKLKLSTVRSLEDFFLNLPVSWLVRGYLLLLVILPVIVWLTSPVLWAICSFVLTLIAPPFMYRFLKKKRFEKLEKQLPGMLISLSNQIRSGASVSTAFKSFKGSMQPPLGQEIDEILRQEKVGRPFIECLDDWQRRVPVFSVKLVAQALKLGLKSGGQQSDIFLRLAENIQQQQHIKERQLTLTSQARMQAKILVLMPAGLYFLLGWIKPNHTAVFTESFIGMGMLAASLLLMILGGWMVKKIMNPDDD